ncbi:MAG: helix-turn-helix domain-containing protein [Moraxella osloensis]|nr:helix-turn-helix domain-containing protein [Moraxella osloensis]
MPNLYDQDLRKRTIAYWQETNNKSKTARTFGICRNTLDSWIDLYQEQGNTEPKKAQPTGVKHIITDLDSFERYVKSKQFNTAKQLREQYLKDHPDVSISYNAFVDTLHRINWTFKKRPSPTKNQTP